MSVSNIIDKRTNSYNVEIDAVFEPSYHDNSVKGSTQFEKPKGKQFTIESVCKTTVEDAINYINQKYKHLSVTVYIYDAGSAPVGDDDYFFMK